MIKAIVTSDNHLGTYYARLRPDRLETRRRALQRAFERVVDAAIQRRVDLFLHAGDLFDRPDPRNAERAFVARQVKRLCDAGIRIVAIAGNHDSPRSYGYDGGIVPHDEMDALGAIHLLRDTDKLAIHTEIIRGQRVVIRGMSSDFNRPPKQCPLADIESTRNGDVDIVLMHYGVEGWAQPMALEPELSLENLDRLNADVICVGHLHARQHKRLPGGALLLNPGSTEHIHFGEEHLHCGYWELRLKPGHAEAEYVALPTQPMFTLQLDMDGIAAMTGETVMDKLLTALDEVSAADQLLRVRLKGKLSREQFQSINLAALQACGEADNFHCQIDISQLTVFDALVDLPLGFGVGFDARTELMHMVNSICESFTDNQIEQEITAQAGDHIVQSFDRLRGAR